MLYDAVEVVVAFGGVYVDVAVDFVVFRCCGFWGFLDVAFGGV